VIIMCAVTLLEGSDTAVWIYHVTWTQKGVGCEGINLLTR
jgi:hypothetical protein